MAGRHPCPLVGKGKTWSFPSGATLTSPIPLRMRAASNPGGIGHDWVRQRFLIEGPSQGRVFVPAKLADNPHLDQREYFSSLSQLDPVTKAPAAFRGSVRKARRVDLQAGVIQAGRAAARGFTVGRVLRPGRHGIHRPERSGLHSPAQGSLLTAPELALRALARLKP
jgi:hypothetical protein